MNQILIECCVPAVGKTFDIIVPSHAKIHEVTKLITTAIGKLESSIFVANNAVLCDKGSGAVLDGEKCVGEIGTKNGEQWMLI